VSGADKIIEGSTDSDTATDFQTLLLGYAGTPNEGDFILQRPSGGSLTSRLIWRKDSGRVWVKADSRRFQPTAP
jgi:hypothetical protein